MPLDWMGEGGSQVQLLLGLEFSPGQIKERNGVERKSSNSRNRWLSLTTFQSVHLCIVWRLPPTFSFSRKPENLPPQTSSFDKNLESGEICQLGFYLTLGGEFVKWCVCFHPTQYYGLPNRGPVSCHVMASV